MKLFTKITLILILGFSILFLICFFLLKQLFYSYSPSSGIWKYNDDDLKIVVYVPPDGGFPTGAYFRCKVDFSYKGETQKAILSYNDKMYSLDLTLVDDYSNIDKESLEKGDLLYSRYSMEKGKWKLKSVKIYDNPYKYTKELKTIYEGRELAFQKIGKYKEPE